MKKHGLHPHLTIMVGYYWKMKNVKETVDFVKELMFSGLARTLQVTLCTPLDYTPYHQECIDKNVLLTKEYEDYDMSKLIVKTQSHMINIMMQSKKCILLLFILNLF